MLAEGDSPIFAFTDGSFIPHSGVASSAAGFERVGLEGFGWPGVPFGPCLRTSLPPRFGAARSLVHEAEGIAALWALGRLPRDELTVWVSDRLALLQCAGSICSASVRELARGSSLVLQSRLRSILYSFMEECPPSAAPSAAEVFPQTVGWESLEGVASVGLPTGRMIPVKVKSHLCENEEHLSSVRFLLHGNAVQDDAAAVAAASGGSWESIRWPTGGFLFFYSLGGFMVTRDPSAEAASWVRGVARIEWASRRVQGAAGRIGSGVHSSCWRYRLMEVVSLPDIRLELSAPVFAVSPCNLAGIAYRAHRCSGCGWTEQLHHNGLWIAAASLFHPAGFSASPRLCPLCLQGPGTPRHLRWVCPGGLGVDLVVFRRAWLRAVEEFLLQWASLPVLLRAGEAWVAASGFRRACLSSPFPVLHA